MELLQRKLAQLKTTWGQMSGSGRLALALTALLIVALLVIVSSRVEGPDMAAIPTRFAPEETARAASFLNARGIRNEIRGDQIYVPADKRSESLRVLASSEALPESGIDFKELLKESNPWSTEAHEQRRWNVALKTELEKLIRAMPGVRNASVNINTGSPNTLRRHPEGASASIVVYCSRSTALRKSTAVAMADMVVGAVNGLTREKVNVIDATNGKSFNLKEDDGTGEYIPLIAQYEDYFDRRLRDHFAYILGLVVTVRAVPNLDRRSERRYEVDPTKTIGGPTSERKDSSTGGVASAPVGVVPNVGTPPVAPVSAVGESRSEETIGHAVDWPRSESVIEHARGDIKEMSVSINVPYSYFVGIEKAKLADPQAKVDDAKVEAALKAETAKIAEHAKTLIAAKDDSAVRVGIYYDAKTDRPEEESGSTTDAAVAVLSRYGPSVALGSMAVLALLMVYSVVRKVQPVAPPPELAPAGAHEHVSEAGLTLDSILEGVELEADTIRASKMQEQISNMIKEDPESVASLVKRWIVQE